MEMAYEVTIASKIRYVVCYVTLGLMSLVPIPQFRVWVLRLLGAKIGKDVLLSPVQFFDYWYAGFKHLQIGDNAHIASGALLDLREKLILENHVTIAERTVVLTHSNVGDSKHPLQKEFPTTLGPVHVKEGSFVGAGCIVLPGVTIGPHSCVMAGSIVSRNVPPHTLVGGNPLRIVRKLI
jgi:acetyltransferase-like isoleucine patch superfamily enzyme